MTTTTSTNISPSSAVTPTIPAAPPRAWFADPRLRALTPLTIDPSGRVYGHLASWRECHLESAALGRTCVTAPRSHTGYGRFQLGAVLTEEGETIATGPIVMGAPHADPEFTLAAALDHYGNSARAVADVRVGEDAHGIWVAGALRPTVTPAQVRELRGSPLSGDWRMNGGHLELVAALAVSTPGFAIPRPQALVASAGGVRAAIGVGVVPQHDPLVYAARAAKVRAERSRAMLPVSEGVKRQKMLARLQRYRRHRAQAAETALVASLSYATALVQPWAGVIAYEGQPTGDSRVIGPQALSATRFPIPLRWAEADTGGHDGAVVVGRIDGAERRPDGSIFGHGVIDLGSDAGREVARQIAGGYAGGVSVDLDSVDGGQIVLDGGATASLTTSARVRAATLVAVPAFESARIELVGSPQPGTAAVLSAPSTTAPTVSPTTSPAASATLAAQTAQDIADSLVVGPDMTDEADDCGCDKPKGVGRDRLDGSAAPFITDAN